MRSTLHTCAEYILSCDKVMWTFVNNIFKLCQTDLHFREYILKFCQGEIHIYTEYKGGKFLWKNFLRNFRRVAAKEFFSNYCYEGSYVPATHRTQKTFNNYFTTCFNLGYIGLIVMLLRTCKFFFKYHISAGYFLKFCPLQ